MRAVTVFKHLSSETLHLPELRPLIGKDVQIVVSEELSRSRPMSSGSIDRLRELASGIAFDFDAFEESRRISTL